MQQIMLTRSSKLEKPKLERAKLADDNLESPEVRGTGVLRRSSGIAVDTRFFEWVNKPLQDIS